MPTSNKPHSTFLVILAFATIYIVWGSTYFFIQVAVREMPPMMLGAIRFLVAGFLLLVWCLIRGEGLGSWSQIKTASITGLMMLLMGTGAVIWAEKWLPSSLVAILISSAPFWFVLLDVPMWKKNFSSKSILIGLAFGFVGVVMMFGENVLEVFTKKGNFYEVVGIFILMIGTMSWSGGSLYSKYHATGSTNILSAWQMTAAGVVFFIGSMVLGEWNGFAVQKVSTNAWLSVLYLIVMGSLAAYSAYVWLLKVRSAAQVSTYAYVNPLIAVLLGVVLANEQLTGMQIGGLVVILSSVLLINLAKYRMGK